MNLFYSAATGGFHSSDLQEPPSDAVPITAERHAELLQAQAEGLCIVAGPDGQPQAVPRQRRAPSRDELLRYLQVDMSVHLNRAAQALGYDSMASAVSYAEDDTVPVWQAEGRALRAWRSTCWSTFYGLTSGTELPSWNQVREQLPPAPVKVSA